MDRVQIAEIKALKSGEVQVHWIDSGTLEIMPSLRIAEEYIFTHTVGDVTICSRVGIVGVLFVSQEKEEILESEVVKPGILHGAIRIGHGQKLHRGHKDKYGVHFFCSCPGTANGNARHKATFFAGVATNCGN